MPAAAPATLTGAPPTANPAMAVALGPLTLLGGGSVIGSTILASSAAAIFTIDSGTAPKQISPAASLTTYAITIADVAGTTLSAAARGQRGTAEALPRRDPELRIPDGPDTERMKRQVRELGRGSAPAAQRTAAVRQVQAFVLGDRKSFTLQGGTINGVANPTPVVMPATLVAQSAHGNVWLDDAVYRNPALLAAEYPSGMSDFTMVASAFEKTFAIETQAFGPAYTTGIVNFAQCDASGAPLADGPPRPDSTGASDPRINIVITDRLKGSGEGGYFYGLDMLDQTEANCVSGTPKPVVNGLPMLVIESDSYPPAAGDAADTYPANNETYWVQGDMPQTIAHEFQHYLHFVDKYLEQHVRNPSDPGAGTLDAAFIDEGCSVLAQDLVAGEAVNGRESPAFVRAFLLEPADFSLTSFTGYQPNALNSTSANPPYGFYRNTAGNYGYAYLFVRYLYDRFGPGALKAIYAETNFNDASEPDTGPATAAAGGEPFTQLFREFTAAIAVHSGGSTAGISTSPVVGFDSSVILRGRVQTYSRRLPPYNVRNIVQGGPLNPEIFTGNIPTGRVRLATGASATVSLLDGGAVFVTAQPPWPQGAALRASGTIAGGGSLGQGSLPTPSPAYF